MHKHIQLFTYLRELFVAIIYKYISDKGKIQVTREKEFTIPPPTHTRTQTHPLPNFCTFGSFRDASEDISHSSLNTAYKW